MTDRLLQRFSRAEVVWIDDYQEIFSRSGQDFGNQKKSPKLIIARKKRDFLYPGNEYVQDFRYRNFFYNALVLNCPYDCHYCYLQGMYRSANQVVFVNQEDYFGAVDEALNRLPSTEAMCLALSYDTDLLALEGMLGLVSDWLSFIRGRDRLHVEVRTKSAAFGHLKDTEPCDRMVFAWTLSPQIIVERYETMTPSLLSRLRSASKAQDDGWPLRLCFDPMIWIPDWRRCYGEMLEAAFSEIDPAKVKDVSVGVFRLNAEYYKKMKRMDRTDLLHSPMQRANNAISYEESIRLEMTHWMSSQLSRYLPEDLIHIWT